MANEKHEFSKRILREDLPCVLCDFHWNLLQCSEWVRAHAPWIAEAASLSEVFLGCGEELAHAAEVLHSRAYYHSSALEIHLQKTEAFFFVEDEDTICVLWAMEENELSSSAFLPQISDRYRIPVLNIVNVLSALAVSLENDEQYALLSKLNSAMRSCYSLLGRANAIRSYSLLVNGRMESHPEPVMLNEYLDGLCKTLQILFSNVDYRITFSGESTPIAAEIDERLLSLALFQLIANSRLYSPAGSTIHVSLAQYKGTAMIEVRDEGIGMSPQELERAFEPFFVGDVQSLAESERGLGLGLPIAQKIAMLHGGSITASSEENRGTSMLLRLPTITPDSRELQLHAPMTKYVTDRFSDIYTIFSELCELTFF